MAFIPGQKMPRYKCSHPLTAPPFSLQLPCNSCVPSPTLKNIQPLRFLALSLSRQFFLSSLTSLSLSPPGAATKRRAGRHGRRRSGAPGLPAADRAGVREATAGGGSNGPDGRRHRLEISAPAGGARGVEMQCRPPAGAGARARHREGAG